jgi:hypothetical protein
MPETGWPTEGGSPQPNLDWKKINPDIFGSMIQAVAEDEERGMHYTSVPNILKVLNPLFLDDLRAKLQEADDNPRMLLNLRNRMARIRVFDPACGSGKFLVADPRIQHLAPCVRLLLREAVLDASLRRRLMKTSSAICASILPPRG